MSSDAVLFFLHDCMQKRADASETEVERQDREYDEVHTYTTHTYEHTQR
jgi:hypothetical protein